MPEQLGGSLMQMRRKQDLRWQAACQARAAGPSSCHRHDAVMAVKGGQLDKTDDIIPLRSWGSGPSAERVAFDRKELQTILGFYGRKVAGGRRNCRSTASSRIPHSRAGRACIQLLRRVAWC
jgi:hypothetical protein